jgi:hypothetical protein
MMLAYTNEGIMTQCKECGKKFKKIAKSQFLCLECMEMINKDFEKHDIRKNKICA